MKRDEKATDCIQTNAQIKHARAKPNRQRIEQILNEIHKIVLIGRFGLKKEELAGYFEIGQFGAEFASRKLPEKLVNESRSI